MIRVQRRLWLEKKGESAMQENNFKKKVREAYLSCLMEELAHARRGHAEAKRDTIAAEGRMVTRYDSTKT